MPHLTIEGHRLYYEWLGGYDPARPTAVFLHDGLGTIRSWRAVPERIGAAAGLNALAYDRWGYGRSDPREEFPHGFMEAEMPALRGLLDALGIERASLIGHSDGGSIALLLAARHPERVTALVTEAAHTFIEPQTQAAIGGLLQAQAAGRTPEWIARLHGERGERLLAAWAASWIDPEHAGWQIEDWLGYITAPTLVIQGDGDDFGTLAQVRSIMNRIGGAEQWIVPDCGHTPHTEVGDAFVERVAEFLGRHVAD